MFRELCSILELQHDFTRQKNVNRFVTDREWTRHHGQKDPPLTLLQMEHLNGLSPVWVRVWICRALALEKGFRHTSHMCLGRRATSPPSLPWVELPGDCSFFTVLLSGNNLLLLLLLLLLLCLLLLGLESVSYTHLRAHETA